MASIAKWPAADVGAMSERASEKQGDYVSTEALREELDAPCLEWITIEHPDEMYMLGEDDYVLDTHFNAEYDTWEALVLLRPETGEENE